ncbi:MAG: CapA family protein [Polyangiaceae bacterium]
MAKFGWLCVGLVACANTAGAPEPARRPAPSAQPAPSALPIAIASAPPAPAPVSRAPLVIVAGGDVSLAREVGQRLLRDTEFDPLAGVARVFRSADVRFVNLESQLSFQNGETQSPTHRLVFTGPPEGAQALARAGVTLVSTANNHAWDYGRGALFETLDNLEHAGVRSVGSGRDLEQAWRAVSLEVKGLRVAFLAVTSVWNQGPIELHEGREHVAWANIEALRTALAALREGHDLVVLSYHGGAEYQDAPADSSKRFVQAAFDAGVDIVLGHHPHVIQGVGFQRDRAVFYSLGNLVFGPRPEHPWTRYGMLAKITIEPSGARIYALCPYRIEGFTPVLLDAAADAGPRSRFLGHVKGASTAIAGIRWGASDADGCTEVLPASLTPPSLGPPRVDRGSRPLAQR